MSMRRLAVATATLCLLGAAIAAYLTWVRFAGLEPYCTGGGGGCERVQSSAYAQLGGVPVAAIGLGGYLAILASLALPHSGGRSVTAFLALVGLGFSAYLTYVELAIIQAICQWCMASAAVMTAVAVTSIGRLVLGERDREAAASH
jgi:uncharacterized membrane protein